MHHLILTTCPDSETAERIAQALVTEGLCACVNILPPMRSVYRWKGAVETASEQLLLIKTRADAQAAIEARVRDLHPYELPEIIAVRIVAGLPAYLAWLTNPDN
jgi:periplasmic divalent cation tolerance protein